MGRKKVAILLPWLKMGGTNKVALRFAKELSKYYDVTIVLSENSGELLGEVPNNINIIIDEMRNCRRDEGRHPQGHHRLQLLRRAVRHFLPQQGRSAAAGRGCGLHAVSAGHPAGQGLRPAHRRGRRAPGERRRAVLRTGFQDHDRPVRRQAELHPCLLRPYRFGQLRAQLHEGQA